MFDNWTESIRPYTRCRSRVQAHNRTVLCGTVQLRSNVLAPPGLSDLPLQGMRTEEQQQCLSDRDAPSQ